MRNILTGSKFDLTSFFWYRSSMKFDPSDHRMEGTKGKRGQKDSLKRREWKSGVF